MNIKFKSGFTLIELLIVIVIMGIVMALITTNLFGARQRGGDSQKKSNLKELKTALQLYFVDYRIYPATDSGLYFKACGQDGNQRCPVCANADFAAGGTDGCLRVYANKLELTNGRFPNIRYYQCSGGDDFRLKISLDNASDADIAESKIRCPKATCLLSTLGEYGANDYVLCNN